MKRLTDDDIRKLYEEFQTPAHVRAHCRAVTLCALSLAEALTMADPSIHLDLQLIYGAGMVHDMARKFDRHEEVGADRLKELHFEEESRIVREHMRTMDYHGIDQVTEADLLYISDRMVREDAFVGVAARFDDFRQKMILRGINPDNERARKNRANAENFVKEIEKKTGKSVFEICS